MTYATLNFYPRKDPKMRFFALWYFTTLLILWTILGDTVLGFEQSYAQPIVGVLAACAVAFLLEGIDAWAKRRPARFAGSWTNVINFLPPCIIPGLACAMLIYPNERLTPIIFASALSLASKVMLRAPIGNGQTQHIFNPSNFGITITLLSDSERWIGSAVPVHRKPDRILALADTCGHTCDRDDYPCEIHRQVAASDGVVSGIRRPGRDTQPDFSFASGSAVPAHDQRRIHSIFAVYDS